MNLVGIRSRHSGMGSNRLGLRAKVFIALLVSVVLAVVATSIAARFAFLSGFLGYLNHQEMARVRRMLPELAVEYDQRGGWIHDRGCAGAANAFEHQQLVSTWIIGAAAVGLAGVLSIVLTSRILKPIRNFSLAAHRLAAGDYGIRLEVDSSDEVGRLAADFNRMALTLEKNEALRRRLVADVSHELRTPVAILRAELEALGDKVRDLSAESLKSLQTEVALLGKLITDLHELSMADLGALAYRMARVDIADLLRWRVAAFQDRYAGNGIAIETSIPERALNIDADEIRIQQLLNNLLENSLRYTDRGGCVRVLCHAQANTVIIDVQDSAPGVPEELLPRLFERFYRVDASRNRASGGSGLGLAIARSVVQAHAGEIRASGSPLGGLWIRVTLPIAR